jgi:3-methyl-2-oxobutanoate hydroxymethyltransferase
MLPGPSPRFVRRYAEIRERQIEALGRFVSEVRERTFPSAAESYE